MSGAWLRGAAPGGMGGGGARPAGPPPAVQAAGRPRPYPPGPIREEAPGSMPRDPGRGGEGKRPHVTRRGRGHDALVTQPSRRGYPRPREGAPGPGEMQDTLGPQLRSARGPPWRPGPRLCRSARRRGRAWAGRGAVPQAGGAQGCAVLALACSLGFRPSGQCQPQPCAL